MTKRIPVSLNSGEEGTYTFTREQLLANSFPTKVGSYNQCQGYVYPLYDNTAKRLKKATATWVFEKHDYNGWNTDIPSIFIPELKLKVECTSSWSGIPDEYKSKVIITDIETFEKKIIFDLTTLAEDKCNGIYWDSSTERLLLFSDTIILLGGDRFVHITAIDLDGNVTDEQREFQIHLITNGPNERSSISYAVIGRTIYAVEGQPTNVTAGITAVNIDTWTETVIDVPLSSIDSYLKPTYFIPSQGEQNKLLLSNNNAFGYLDVDTNELVYDVNFKDNGWQNYPAIVEAGFVEDDETYGLKLYDCITSEGHEYHLYLQRKKRDYSDDYPTFIFDVDMEKLKTDQYNCLSNPRSIDYDNPRYPDDHEQVTGNIAVICQSAKLPTLMVFSYGHGQGSTAGAAVTLSNDGGLSQRHFFGVGRTSDDVKGWVNTFGIWDDIEMFDECIWLTGPYGVGKLVPLAQPGDLMCAWDDETSDPYAVSRDRWAEFFFTA